MQNLMICYLIGIVSNAHNIEQKIEKLREMYKSQLDSNIYELRSGAKKSDIEEMREYNFELPEDYKNFLSFTDGWENTPAYELLTTQEILENIIVEEMLDEISDYIGKEEFSRFKKAFFIGCDTVSQHQYLFYNLGVKEKNW